MFEIKTSYYANRWSYKGYVRVGISRYAPQGSCDLRLMDFAPSARTLFDYKEGRIDEKEYEREYLNDLDRLYENKRMDELVDKLKKYEKVVLLCYEGKGKFCHRHILGKYLNEKYDLKIEEL